jgi:hypothetical protein
VAHKIIRVSHQAIVGQAFAASLLTVMRAPCCRPCLGEMLVKDREGNIGEQGRKDPALWRTSARSPKLAVLSEDVRLHERLHQIQHTLAPDPASHTG